MNAAQLMMNLSAAPQRTEIAQMTDTTTPGAKTRQRISPTVKTGICDVSDLLTPGTNRCQCPQCGRVFASVNLFARHLTTAKNGDARCHDPATLRRNDEPVMTCRNGVWGWAGERPDFLPRGEGRGR